MFFYILYIGHAGLIIYISFLLIKYTTCFLYVNRKVGFLLGGSVVASVVYFIHVYHSQSAGYHVRPPAMCRGRLTRVLQ